MKLDTTGLESFAPLHGRMDDLHGELWAPPSFDLPVCADVSLCSFLFSF